MERTGDASRDLGRGGSALVLDSKKIITKVSVPPFFKKMYSNSNSSRLVRTCESVSPWWGDGTFGVWECPRQGLICLTGYTKENFNKHTLYCSYSNLSPAHSHLTSSFPFFSRSCTYPLVQSCCIGDGHPRCWGRCPPPLGY